MRPEDAWDELVALKNSWDERKLPANDAFILFGSMVCRFAFANNMPLNVLQNTIKELLTLIYDDLKDLPNFKPE